LLAQLFGIASRYVAAKSKALALHIQEQKTLVWRSLQITPY